MDVHVINGNGVKRLVVRNQVFVLLDKTKEAPEIKIVFIYGASGMSLNGLVIDQEIPDQRRSLGTVVRMHEMCVSPPLRSTKFLFC